MVRQHETSDSDLRPSADQLRRVQETAADLRTNSNPRIVSEHTLRRATLADSDPDWRHWPDVRPIAREVIYTASSLTSSDMIHRVRLADVGPDDPVMVRLFEVQGDIDDLAAHAQSSASHASLRYHVLRHRRGLDPQSALQQALSEISPFWRSTPRRFLRVGQRIRFGTAHKTWHVQAVSDNFVALVQQVPFEPRGTKQYTVIDWARGIRGPANLIGWGYGDGTYSHSECANMLREFEYDVDSADMSEVADDTNSAPVMQGLEVSRRNNVPIDDFAVLSAS
jgi:hypothetical protein